MISIWSTTVTFNILKVSQSRPMIDRFCHDEGFELTYYIETLDLIIIKIPLIPSWNLKTICTPHFVWQHTYFSLSWDCSLSIIILFHYMTFWISIGWSSEQAFMPITEHQLLLYKNIDGFSNVLCETAPI